MDCLTNGLTYGFDTGMESLPSANLECKNNRSALKNSDFVDQALAEEVSKGYMAGPFDDPPFSSSYRVSPISVAAHKYSGKKRVVLDLSAPHDGEGEPINDLIDKDKHSLTYVKVDDAVQRIQHMGKGTILSKFDIADAFKIIPINPSLYCFH